METSRVPYEMREVSLYGAGGKPDWFWELNPAGTVPVVAVEEGGSGGEDVFADSELILDAVGDGRIAGGADDTVAVLARNGELSSEENERVRRWRSIVSERLAPVGKSAVLGGSLPKLRTLLKELNDAVEGPYLAGDRVTTADCAAFPFLWRIDQEFGIGGKDGGDDERKLHAWLDECAGVDSIRRTIPSGGWWWWW